MTAGIALGLVAKSTTIDAVVMASAALRGDTIVGTIQTEKE